MFSEEESCELYVVGGGYGPRTFACHTIFFVFRLLFHKKKQCLDALVRDPVADHAVGLVEVEVPAIARGIRDREVGHDQILVGDMLVHPTSVIVFMSEI